MNAHNSTRFLAPALASALGQTMGDLEVVVWDNASTDRAEEIASSFGDDRVRYFFTTEKVPLYQARCDAVGACKGEYVAFLDCDDVWMPDKLERQLKAIERMGAVCACSDYEYFTEGRPDDLALTRAYPDDKVGLAAALMPYGVGMSCLIARRDVLQDVLPNPVPDWFFIEDLDIVSRLLMRGPIAVVHAPLMQYRIHGSNASHDRSAYVREVNAWLLDMAERPVDAASLRAITRYYTTQSRRSQVAQLVAAGKRRDAFMVWVAMPRSLTKVKWLLGLASPKSLAAKYI